MKKRSGASDAGALRSRSYATRNQKWQARVAQNEKQKEKGWKILINPKFKRTYETFENN